MNLKDDTTNVNGPHSRVQKPTLDRELSFDKVQLDGKSKKSFIIRISIFSVDDKYLRQVLHKKAQLIRSTINPSNDVKIDEGSRV